MSWDDWYFEKACAHYKNNEFGEAVELFSKAVENPKTKAKALYYKGSSLYELGLRLEKIQKFEEANQNFEEAKNAFKEVEASNNWEILLGNELKGTHYYKKGLLFYHTRDYDPAKDAFSKAVNLMKMKGKVFFQLGLANYKLGNFEEAITSFTKAINSSDYEKGKTLFHLGLANYKLKNFEEAFKNLKEAIYNSYYDKEILTQLMESFNETFKKGFILYHLKRYNDAIQIFEKLCEKRDENEEIYEIIFYKALSQYELKELDESFKEFDSLTEKHQQPLGSNKEIVAKSWYYKGLILSELKNGENLKGSISDLYRQKQYSNSSEGSQNHEFSELKESERIIDYRTWDLKKLEEFNGSLKNDKTTSTKNKNQKIFDVNSQIAFNEALEKYKELIDENKENALYYEKALILNELKQYNEAIKAIDEFLKNKPRDEKAWLKKGTVLLKLAKYEESKNALKKSIEYFEILIDENPGNPDHWYNKGTAHSSLAEVLIKTRYYQGSVNEYEEAVKAFDNATTLNPDFSLAWNNKGNAYLKLKKHNKAIEAFEKAFDINRNYYLALHNKGDALYSLGKYLEAIDVYEQVIYEEREKKKERISDPNVFKSWNDKGLALYKLERYIEAIGAFNRALDINPTFADGWTNKGVVFYKLEMFSEAKKAFEEALKIDPGNALASNNLGIVLAIGGELDRTKKLFENTLEENPDFIFGHINLAELFLNNGGVERASEEIEKTLDIVKDNEDYDINLDYIYYLDGRIKIEAQSKDKEIKSKDINKKYSEAVKSFEKALSFNVEDPGLILWSVYAKYLCQKFETNGQTNSSEESKPDKETILSKSESIYSYELFHSIVCDLTKVLYFCNLSVIKNNLISNKIDKRSLFNKNFFLTPVMLLLILTLLLKLILLIWGPLEQVIKLLNSYLSYLLIIIFLILILGFVKSILLSVSLLDQFEKSILKKRMREPLHWIDQLIEYRLFKLRWLFRKIRSYVKFIVSNYQSLEPQTSKENDSYTNDVTHLNALIKEKEYLIKFDRYKEIKAYTLYLLGYFYYKLKDYTTAKEKLQECINLRPDPKIDKSARELLDGIWKHKIKPPFWTYWFNSPVRTWRRRAFGALIILGILLILFVHPENPQPVAWNESTSNDSENFIPDEINIYPYIISYYPLNNTSSDSTDSTEDDSNTDDDNTDADSDNTNNGNSVTTWNILTPARVNIYPYIVSYYPLNNTSSDSTDSVGNDINTGNDNTLTSSDNTNNNNNTTWNILTPARVNIYPDIPDNYFDAILLLILILILISPSVRIVENVKLILKKGADVSLDLGPIAAPPEFNFELSPSLMQDVIRRLDENL